MGGFEYEFSFHEARGDLFTLRGEYSAAISSYQTAAAFCSPACLSNVLHKLGEVYHRRGEWEAAEGHYSTALESAPEKTATQVGSPTCLRIGA